MYKSLWRCLPLALKNQMIIFLVTKVKGSECNLGPNNDLQLTACKRAKPSVTHQGPNCVSSVNMGVGISLAPLPKENTVCSRLPDLRFRIETLPRNDQSQKGKV